MNDFFKSSGTYNEFFELVGVLETTIYGFPK
jgi:hypothetical protein